MEGTPETYRELQLSHVRQLLDCSAEKATHVGGNWNESDWNLVQCTHDYSGSTSTKGKEATNNVWFKFSHDGSCRAVVPVNTQKSKSNAITRHTKKGGSFTTSVGISSRK